MWFGGKGVATGASVTVCNKHAHVTLRALLVQLSIELSQVNDYLPCPMSTTTQILFNSPALHSLKRDQLVKLCKIHSIKANGKNVELIQRLRQHAQSMPKDSPLSIAARSEPSGPIPLQAPNHEEEEEEMDDPASHRNRMARPSEQWEMVMDSIEEVEEGSSQGTLSSQRTINNPIPGEFGTGSSRCTFIHLHLRFILVTHEL